MTINSTLLHCPYPHASTPSRPLGLSKALLLFLLLGLKLIQNNLFRNLIRIHSLNLLRELQSPFLLRQRNHIPTTRRIQHPRLNLRPTRTRRNEHDRRLRIVVPVEREPRLRRINRRRERSGRSPRRRHELQRLSRDIDAELDQVIALAGAQRLQRGLDLGVDVDGEAAALREPLGAGAPRLEGLGLLDVEQALLLGGQRVLALRVLDVFLPALLGQLGGLGAEDALGEVLAAQLARQRQPRAGEEHLLPHRRRIGHEGDGHEGFVRRGERVGAAEEDVEGGRGVDVVGERGEVGEEGGCGRGDGRGGDYGFVGDGC